MRSLFITAAAVILLTTACGSSEPPGDAGRAPAPRAAPSQTEPEESFDEAPRGAGPGAGAPAPQPDKAAADICDGLAGVPEAESPEDALRSLATKARREGVQFSRFVTLLSKAYAKGDVDKASSYIDRLAAICEDVTGRRNF